MTDIEKNLAIASMESALEYAHARAHITTLSTLERLVRQLRELYQVNPDLCSDYLIRRAVEIITRAELPSLKNIRRIFEMVKKARPTSGSTATTGKTTGTFNAATTFNGSTTFNGA
jgi:hypothetical protein